MAFSIPFLSKRKSAAAEIPDPRDIFKENAISFLFFF